MCLYVKDIPEDFKPLTADKDIHVFKVLFRNEVSPKHNVKRYAYCTPFKGVTINFDFWGKCVMEADMDGTYKEITIATENESHESRVSNVVTYDMLWKNGEEVLNTMKTASGDYYLEIEEGIHAYTSFTGAAANWSINDFPCYEIHKAVIPKGAHYFIGIYDEIVADKMIICKKKAKNKEKK